MTSLGLCKCGRTVSRFGYLGAVRCNGCAALPNDCKCPHVQVLHGEWTPYLPIQYPNKLRDRIGTFMLGHGVKMGVAIDPGEVQDLIEAWEKQAHPGLEEECNRWRKLAEDAINLVPTQASFKCLRCGVVAPLIDEEIAKHRSGGCKGPTEALAASVDQRETYDLMPRPRNDAACGQGPVTSSPRAERSKRKDF